MEQIQTMNISFYDDIEIVRFYDMVSNPFKIGDVISLDVNELYPIELEKYNNELQVSFSEKVSEVSKKYRHKKIKLIEEEKYVTINLLKKSIINIEYFCEFIDKEK